MYNKNPPSGSFFDSESFDSDRISTLFDKVLYHRTIIGPGCVDYNLQVYAKEVKILSLSKYRQQKVKIVHSEIYSHIQPIINRLISMEKLKNASTSASLPSLIENWLKITSNPLILDIVKEYQIPFLESKPFQLSPSTSLSISQRQMLLVDQQIQ